MDKNLNFRTATKEDLPGIIRMLADDILGASREMISAGYSEKYLKAFEKIQSDPNQELTVVEMNGQTVATFQLTFIQYLNHEGGLRAQVESVMTDSGFRRQGIGTEMIKYAIRRAGEKGCVLIQLTSDKKRPDAIRFYKSLGFIDSHEGMKLKINYLNS